MSCPSSRLRLNGVGQSHVDFAVYRDIADVVHRHALQKPRQERKWTDLEPKPDRSRGGTRPISAISWSPLTAVAAALASAIAIGPVIAILELAALGIGG
jgi:hypothetical protein